MQTFVLLSLAFIMFSLGTTLAGTDFAAVFKNRRVLLLAACCHLVLLPLLGFGIAALCQLPYAAAVGLVLIAACPAGATSNYFTFLARGDVALAVSLTVISSLATTFTLPAYLWLAMQWFSGNSSGVHMDLLETVRSIFLLTLLPVLCGMALRRYAPDRIGRAQRALTLLAGLLFAAVMINAWLREWQLILGGSLLLVLATVALNLSALSCGELVGRAIGLDYARRSTLILETGIQNGAFAVGMAIYVLQQPLFAVPAAIYSVAMVLTGLGVVWLRRRGPRRADTPRNPLHTSAPAE